MESVKLVPGGEGSLLVAITWFAGLVGGVSIGWQCCRSILAASAFSSIVFMAGAGDEEREEDAHRTSCRLVIERVGVGWLVHVEEGGDSSGEGGRLLLLAD